jgi:hypothetical protein
VAPYEADAQMAYLARNGAVHAVITEDSDLLAYGCPRSAQPSLQHALHCTAQHGTCHSSILVPGIAVTPCDLCDSLLPTSPWSM